ncbi:MAG TPA: hypothetical protein VF041_02030 [Gemmatimonadaceae bacterium]
MREPDTVHHCAGFEGAIAALGADQRSVLRMLLTGAPFALVVSLAAVEPRLVEEWLGNGGPLHAAIDALHHDIPASLRTRLRALVQREIRASDALPHDASARASLVLVRAIGSLDAEQHLLEHSALRRDEWSGGGS